jgi:hypothetical protein
MWKSGDECGVKLATGEVIQDWEIQVISHERNTARVWHPETDRVWLRDISTLVCIHIRSTPQGLNCAWQHGEFYLCEHCPNRVNIEAR